MEGEGRQEGEVDTVLPGEEEEEEEATVEDKVTTVKEGDMEEEAMAERVTAEVAMVVTEGVTEVALAEEGGTTRIEKD